MSFYPHGPNTLSVQDIRRVRQLLESRGRRIEIIREVKNDKRTD